MWRDFYPNSKLFLKSVCIPINYVISREMGVFFTVRMEKVKQWWRVRLSFRNATMVVCFLNLLTAMFLLHGFLSASSTRKLPAHQSISAQIKYIKESEEIRRAMEPVELIKRVREIEREAYVKPEAIQQKDTKQTAAVDLISRLNDFHINSDAASMKALEEWRKRKMERAKHRGFGKNVTITGQA